MTSMLTKWSSSRMAWIRRSALKTAVRSSSQRNAGLELWRKWSCGRPKAGGDIGTVSAELYTNVFKLDQVLGRIDEIEAAIVPAVAKVDRQEARTQEQQAAWFKAQITRRHDALSQQLGAPGTNL